MWLNPITLENEFVKLESLSIAHSEALIEAASDGKLWELWYTSVPSEQTIAEYIKTALDAQSRGLALPFVVVDKANNTIVGSTRFCNADPTNKRLEIGYTWYAKRVQRSAINTACKSLLLEHAFEKLSCIAVEFRTHWHNQASRQAIARLGAKQDGVLRNHQQLADGSFRDTVVFSIINSEWPAVKRALAHKLAR